MKRETPITTRCLALIMALAMFFTCNANLGLALQVFAEEGKVSVSTGSVVADNYDLSEAESALLKSGYLTGTVSYDEFNANGLFRVDPENRTIFANAQGNWVPTKATLTPAEGEPEVFDVSSGSGQYQYDGNAFAIKVAYELRLEDADIDDEGVLAAVAALKKGVANGAAAVAVEGLDTIVEAMPVLVKLCNGIEVNGVLCTFDEATIAAIQALNAQVETSGRLNLQIANQEYKAASSKIGYLQGGYKDVIVATYNNLNTIKNDSLMSNSLLQYYMLPTEWSLWNSFLAALGKAVDGLEPIAGNTADWSILGLELAKDADAALDALVSALPENLTANANLEYFLLASAETGFNMSMQDVKVTVELKQVNSANEVVVTKTVTDEVQMVDGTENDILQAKVNEIAAKYVAAWELDTNNYKLVEMTELPDELTDTVECTVTYAPVEYKVTYSGTDYAAGAEESLPYGYVLTLPEHTDAAKAYDYKVNGETYAQGTTYTVVGDTTVSRTAGKAYTSYRLYSVIAGNYGSSTIKNVLRSGALAGDKTINVRMPSAADSENLLTLADGKLTVASSYDANYEGLKWYPYSYGTTGTENSFEGEYEVVWNNNQAKVQYRLDLTNYSDEEVKALLDKIVALEKEVTAQADALSRLSSKLNDMSSLTNTILNFIDVTVDETKFSDDEAENAAMRQHFHNTINDVKENCMSDGKLIVYNTMSNGMSLSQYYQNDSLEAEVETLSHYLVAMLPDEEHENALSLLIESLADSDPGNFGSYREYGAKVAELKNDIAEINKDLTPASDMVLTADVDALNILLSALTASDTASYDVIGNPYLTSDTLTVADESTVTVQATVTVGTNGEAKSFTTDSYNRGYTLQQADVDALMDQVKAFAVSEVGSEENLQHYEVSGLNELNALVGTKPTEKLTTVTVTYTPKIYTVQIGETSATYSIEQPTVTLPAHASVGYQYEYTIGDETIIVKNGQQAYSLNMTAYLGTEQITCKEVNYASEDAKEDLVNAQVLELIEDADGNVTGIVVHLEPTKESLMQMVKEFNDLGYSYIALNEDNVLLNNDGLYSVQAIIDTILEDNSFSNQTLIALGQNNGGCVFTGTMDLGTNATNIVMNDLTFEFELKSLNSKAVEYLGYLEQIKNYVSFQSNNGELDIDVNLPEKVYEVYLTAMIAEGTVDIDDAAAVDKYVAVHFIADYIAMVTKTNADTTTFKNTIEMLYQVVEKASDLTESVDKIPDVSVDPSDLPNAAAVTDYEAYYQWLKKTINEATYDEATGTIDALLSADGKIAIDKLLTLAGMSADSLSTELSLVKEYDSSEVLRAKISVDVNANHEFEAVVIDSVALKNGAKEMKTLLKQLNTGMTMAELLDWAADVKATGLHNGIDYTNDLPARAASVQGGAVVVLLGDTDGVTFNGTTILDLNGKTVNGDITANGPLYIMDSSLDTNNGGQVTGQVTGSNVTIVGGTYDKADVAPYLPDGYVQDSGSVHNCMYTIDVDSNGNLTFEINADYMYECDGYLPSVKALAADIALDLAMNLYPAASLTVNGCEFYNIDGVTDSNGKEQSTQLDNLLKLALDANSAEYLIDEALMTLSVPGIADFINIVMKDLLDFKTIANSLPNGVFASYTLEAAPYAISIDHITDGDYMTAGVVADAKHSKSATVSLKMVGDNTGKLATCFSILDAVVEEASIKLVDVKDLTYDAKNFNLSGGVEASASLDLTNFTEQVMVVLAHGLYNDGNTANDPKADAIITALNFAYSGSDSANTNALHEAFDELTAEEVLTALKVLNREDTLESIYAGLAADHGLDIGYDAYNATVEKAVIVALSAVGKMMEELSINGSSSDQMYQIATMADAEEDCHDVVSYAHSITYSRSANVSVTEVLNFLDTHGINVIRYLDAYGINVDGYGVNLNLTTSKASLEVELFDECAHDWVTVNPTCSKEEGVTNGYSECKHCRKRIDIIGSHDFSDGWKCDGENHWYECKNCGYIADKGAHVPGAWVVTKQPSTTEYGWEEQYCATCKKLLQGRSIDKLVAPATPTTPSTPTSPDTADTFNVYLWSILTVVSGAAVVGLFAWKKRKLFK